jgi:hypothetical protein
MLSGVLCIKSEKYKGILIGAVCLYSCPLVHFIIETTKRISTNFRFVVKINVKYKYDFRSSQLNITRNLHEVRIEIRFYNVQTMVYNTQNYWGFWTLSIFRYSEKIENTKFRKLNLFPSSDEGQTPTLFSPSETASLNHWTTHVTITTAI